LLIVFLIPATVIFHNFWAFEGQEQQMQMIMFLKNLAILGGLLLVVGFGAGAYSLDNRCGSCVSSSPVSGTASPTA
ncbi:MAG: DoxX family protein, partial [Gemmataceae bacterium]|nr:DoxX family protein [Gemmataceae bacterium]